MSDHRAALNYRTYYVKIAGTTGSFINDPDRAVGWRVIGGHEMAARRAAAEQWGLGSSCTLIRTDGVGFNTRYFYRVEPKGSDEPVEIVVFHSKRNKR